MQNQTQNQVNTNQENKREKNNNKLLIIVLILLLIVALLFGIYAWSKYTSTYNGNGTAAIATWDFGTDTEIKGIDLAKTSGATTMDNVNNVKADKIAPGTSGHFDIDLNPKGTDVALSYEVILSNITNKPKNLHFYSNSECTEDHLIDTTDGAEITGTIAQGDTGANKTVTFYWKWDYETGKTADQINAQDVIDTTDGQNVENNGVTFDLTIRGTQINPHDNQAITNESITTK